jgi:hypothetical protein
LASLAETAKIPHNGGMLDYWLSWVIVWLARALVVLVAVKWVLIALASGH